MIIDLNLCSTPIEPFNTLYFENKQSQKEYFESVTKKTIKDCSYNGSRAIRINMNYLQLTNLEYNYLYFEYDNRVYYCFIDDYTYINDNCSAVNVTVDYIQTYMFDYTLKKSLVKSQTCKQDFLRGRSFSQFPVSRDILTKLNEIVEKHPIMYGENEDLILTYFCVTLSGNLGDTSIGNLNSRFIVNGRIIDATCIYIPYFYDRKNKKFIRTYIQLSINETDDILTKIFNSQDVASAVQDVTILWNAPFDFNDNDWEFVYYKTIGNPHIVITAKDTSNLPQYINNGGMKIEYTSYIGGELKGGYILSYTENSDGFIIPKQRYDCGSIILNAKNRMPYSHIIIGNQNNQIELNMFDFIDCPYSENPYEFYIDIEVSPLYPFNSNVTFVLKQNNLEYVYPIKNTQFKFNATSPFPFSVSKWAEYYSQNSASIKDGLYTQQKYDRQIAKRNRDIGIVSGVVKTAGQVAGSVATFGASTMIPNAMIGLGNIYGDASFAYKGYALKEQSIARYNSSVTNSVTAGATGLMGSIVSYENTLTEQEKQRELLQIQWNDIKSAPDILSSLDNSFITDILFSDLCIKIFLVSVSNISDIELYHKIYGYEYDAFNDINIKNHTVFDYISINDVNIYSLLPSFITDQIVAIYESGIRFWYDEAKFLNYDVDNTEVQNG